MDRTRILWYVQRFLLFQEYKVHQLHHLWCSGQMNMWELIQRILRWQQQSIKPRVGSFLQSMGLVWQHRSYAHETSPKYRRLCSTVPLPNPGSWDVSGEEIRATLGVRQWRALVWSPVSSFPYGVCVLNGWSHQIEAVTTIRRALLKSRLDQERSSCMLSHWDMGIVC